jgi:hypothetical protein
MDVDPEETVVTIQTVHGKSMRFDAGKGAVQVATARRSAPLWVRDVMMCVPLVGVLSLAGVVITAYGTTMAAPEIWLYVPFHAALLFIVMPAWMIGVCWRTRAFLYATLLFTIGCIGTGAAGLLAWKSIYMSAVYSHAPWLWWTLFWILFAEVVVLLGGAIAVCNLTKCVTGVHAHFTLFRSIVRQADGQFARGDLGGTAPHEPTLGGGAVALASSRLASDGGGGGTLAKKTD